MTESEENVAIQVKGLTKIYPGSSAGAALRTMSLRLARKSPVGPKALDTINLTVSKGQAVGIVGRNGSGKSTLLKTLAGMLSPTEGTFSVHGRLGTLLDLGSGIHPEYSGAENALVLGMLAGLSKSEVRARMSLIREFSGLGEAFDHPAKTYSSGMSLRLGFSAAIHSDPDVLLIDEALAVGDAFFQQRCLARMRRLREEGTTIVLVSHDPSAVISLCDRAIWLEHGCVSADGSPGEVIKRYLAARYQDDCALDAPLAPVALAGTHPARNLRQEESEQLLRPATPIKNHDDRFGDGRARVVGIEVRDETGNPISSTAVGSLISVVITIRSRDRLVTPLVGFTLRNRLGDVVTATNTELEGIHLPSLEKNHEIDIAFRFSWPSLSSGSFSFSPAVAEGSIASHRMCDWVENVWILEADNSRGLFGWMTLDDVSITDSRPRAARKLPVVPAPPDASAEAKPVQIEFALETPRTAVVERGQITNDAELFLSGWCFALSGEPVRLTAQMADESPRTVVARGFRQDVGQAYTGVPNACHSGFGLLVPVPTTAGPARCRIEASVQGHSMTIAELEIDLPAPIRIFRPEGTKRRKQRRTMKDHHRIVFMSHNLELEGAPRSLFEVANALDSSRFDKHLCSPATGPLEKAWTEAGIPVSRFGWDCSLTSEDDFDAQIRRLAGLASAWRPDLFVANTLETYWAVHVAAELGRPSIWIVRESETPEAYFHSRLPTPIAERARAALSLADRVVFVADATRELFTESLNGSIDRMIPNGLDLARFDLATIPARRAEIRRELRLSGSTPLLLCVGTTCLRKAQVELIQALEKLRDSRPDFHCVFLGVVEGEYLTAMRATIDDLGLSRNVTLRKPVLDSRPYFAAADVTICNSYQESSPRVVLESMGFAKPIVASRVFGIPELVRDEVDALLIEPGDIDSLAKAIERLLSDPAMANALGASARLRVTERFSLEGCVHGYSNLLDELLNDSIGADR